MHVDMHMNAAEMQLNVEMRVHVNTFRHETPIKCLQTHKHSHAKQGRIKYVLTKRV